MNKDELIKIAYSKFSNYIKPDQCTNYLEFEDIKFNQMLLSATRRNLNIEQIGTVACSPISSMNAEALAYFMPRLIELTVCGEADLDGDPFYCHFINTFHTNLDSVRFRLFEADQKLVMVKTFEFLCKNYREQLEVEGWFDEAHQAAIDWKGT